MTTITCIEDLRKLAQRRVPRMFYDYADSGSYTESTYRANTSGPVAGGAPVGSASAYAPLPSTTYSATPAPAFAAPANAVAPAGTAPVASQFIGAGQVKEEYANVGQWLDQPKAKSAPANQ